MTETIAPAPVRRSVGVRLPPDRAFRAFVGSIGRWWPRSHSIGGKPLADVVIEPCVGGRWYEVGDDGSTCEWGRVIAYEPSVRLVLAWQIDAGWQFDPDLVTEVEVRFIAEGAGTRVELEHRNLERFGDKAALVAGMIGSESGGWGMILGLYADSATA
jgi:uncharacterized protein YndB with AHSA1/START domain